jgi:hypothetical protein
LKGGEKLKVKHTSYNQEFGKTPLQPPVVKENGNSRAQENGKTLKGLKKMKKRLEQTRFIFSSSI